MSWVGLALTCRQKPITWLDSDDCDHKDDSMSDCDFDPGGGRDAPWVKHVVVSRYFRTLIWAERRPTLA
jgi:hypothetical protein